MTVFSHLLRRWQAAPKLILAPVLFLAASGPLAAETFAVSSGHSAHWYNPDRSGEGLVLEVLDEGSAVVYWFTYDEAGNQRWLLDVGSIDGSTIVFPELSVTRGGRFGLDFDPEQVETRAVGEAVLSFSDCDTAEWSYTAFGEAETLAMTRLTQTMAAGCQSINGVPGQPVMEYAGQSGSWYDPSHAGEGFTLQWMSRNRAALIWFTYDAQGNQYWMTGVGSREGDQIVFPMMRSTRGPSFGPGYDKTKLQTKEWGQLVLDIDCDSGLAAYDSALPEFGQGELILSRLSGLQQPNCPWERPSFDDIYSLSYEELPLNEEGQYTNIQPRDIATTGRVVALNPLSKGYKVLTWEPGDDKMTEVSGIRDLEGVLITPDGSEIIAHDLSPYTPPGLTGGFPMLWDGAEWAEYPNLTETNALVTGLSQSGAQATGMVKLDVESARTRAWRLDDNGGQDVLPIDEDAVGARGYVVSDDGYVVIGHQSFSDGRLSYDYATIWRGDEMPRLLRDEYGYPLAYPYACNVDCSIIAGGYHGGPPDADHPNFEQAWLFVESRGVVYLPRIEGAVERAGIPPYVVQDASNDGSMIVGRYLIDVEGVLGSRAFVWTQHTGMLKIEEIFEGSEVDVEGWFRMDRVRITPNGEYLLISGFELGTVGSPQGRPRAAVIRFDKK